MARASIGKLSVQLSANTAGFQRAMSRAGDTIKRVSAQAAKMGAAVAAVGAAGLAAAAGGLAALTRKGLEAGDALGKNADRLGISTEALAGLQHASELAGVSQEALGKSLQRLNRSLGEALEGTGPAKDALDALGLSAENLATLEADQAVGIIADRLNKLGSTAERSRVAFDLFGRSGIDLFTLFQGGSEGIAAAREEAERLGLVISRTDAAGIERANDAITRLRRVFSGIGQQVAVRLAPIIENLATMMQRVATDGEGIGPKVVGAFRWVIEAAATVGDGIDAIRESILYLKAAYLDFSASAVEALERVGSVGQTVAQALANRLGPNAAAAVAGLSAVANAGLAGAARAARVAADRAQAEAQAGIYGDNSYGVQIRRFGQALLAPTQGPPTRQKQDETKEAIEDVRQEIREQTRELRDALQQLSAGSVNNHLLRLLDRIALGVTGPQPAVTGGGVSFGTDSFDALEVTI